MLSVGQGDGWTWTTDRSEAFAEVGEGYVPIQFDGAVTGPSGAPAPEAILIAVNGTVAGTGTRITEQGPGSWTFSTIVAEELFRTGANTVEALVVDPSGDHDYLSVPDDRVGPTTVLFDDRGQPVSVRAGDREVEIVPADGRQVEIDAAFTDGRTLVIDGWSADTNRDRLPSDILLVVDGDRVSAGVEPYPALAEPTGELAQWGFRLSVPESAVTGSGDGIVLAVFEDGAVATPVSWTG
jgi:hypothetical protein